MRRHIPRLASSVPPKAPKVAQRRFIASTRACGAADVPETPIASSSKTTIFTPPASNPSKPFYITTPIFYVNASPHLGHLHSLVLADTLNRYSKLRYPDRKTFYTTGTDEHGLKIQQAAKNKGLGEQQFCDEVSQTFRHLADTANVEYTDFIRTSEPRHHRAVEHFWGRLVDSGDMYKGTHSGWYSVSDECFYSNTQVTKRDDGIMIAIETGNEVIWEEEENWKFKLPRHKDALRDWINQPLSVYPPNMRSYVTSMIDSAEDLSVSRPSSRVKWGVTVPGDPDQTIYVWVDALINYITSLGYPDNIDGWPVDIHVVGKDIVRFHALHWPALLFSAGLEPPRSLLAHAHWTMGHMKMSKSKGNVVDPLVAMGIYGTDAVRFYLMKDGGSMPNDSDYSAEQLQATYTFLSSQLGNLVSRLSNKKILKRATEYISANKDEEMETAILTARDLYEERMEGLEISKACDTVVELVSQANKTFTQLEPWKAEDTSNALIYSHAALRIAGTLLHPFMPSKSVELLNRIGHPSSPISWNDARVGGLKETDPRVIAGTLEEASKRWKKNGYLFPRIEDAL